MQLSIIIVSWNTRELLEKCLNSIHARKGKLPLEVIVVDNDSADGSREMVADRFPWVRLVNSGANLGFGRGCNLGLGRASSPLILFLNPDTEIIEDALQKMVAFMDANAPVGALNCKIRELSGSAFGPGLQWFPSPLTELAKFFLVSRETQGRLPRLFPYHDPETSGFVRKLFGGCLLVRRCVLDQVGAFDERFFMYCEDVDLSRRIDSAGWKLYYLSEAEIFHLGGSASSRVSGRFSVLMMCESLSKLMRKYHGRLGSWGYRIVALVGAQFRLAILLMLRLLMSLGWSGDKVEVASSFGKYVTITRWSLGLSKPAIPTSVASPGRNVSLSLPAEVTAPADRAGHGA